MSLPDRVRRFIFEFIDSVETLDVLMVMFNTPGRAWTARQLADELRLNQNSVIDRVASLRAHDLVRRQLDTFYYEGDQPWHDDVRALHDFYASHRHRVIEAICAPARKAHVFARAFRLRGRPIGKAGDDD